MDGGKYDDDGDYDYDDDFVAAYEHPVYISTQPIRRRMGRRIVHWSAMDPGPQCLQFCRSVTRYTRVTGSGSTPQ